MKNYLIRSITTLILTTSLVSGCAGIPGGNIKLENYPKIEQNTMDKIDVSAEFYPSKDIKEEDERAFIYSLEGLSTKKVKSNHCFAKVYSKTNDKDRNRVRISDTPAILYGAVCQLSLAIIPCYKQFSYQAQATLISYPSESSLKDKAINILPDQVNFSSDKIQIKHTKQGNYLITENKKRINEGDYFLDENGRITKLLKTYELKDKMHEVWSSLWMISWFIVDSWGKGPTPKVAKEMVEKNISEALVRSILNDASQFEECKKDQPSSPRKE